MGNVRRAVTLMAALAVAASVLAATGSAVAQPPTCMGQDADIVGTNGPDLLVGTQGPDVIVGLRGNDRIRGLGGNDLICPGRGHDTVFAGPGADVVNAGRGDDRIFGQAGPDLLNGGPGHDFAYGGGGGDQLNGGPGFDFLLGGGGEDSAIGGPRQDECFTENRATCEFDLRDPHVVALEFVTRAIEGQSIIHYFQGRELHANGPNDFFYTPYNPRPDARATYQLLERFRGDNYTVSNLSSNTCAQFLGGDFSYPCSFTVSSPQEGSHDYTMSFDFGQKLFGPPQVQ